MTREAIRERSKKFSLEDQVLFSLFCDPFYQEVEVEPRDALSRLKNLSTSNERTTEKKRVPVYLGVTNLRIWLLEQTLFNEHDLFGNRLNKQRIFELIHSLKVYDPNSRKVKKRTFRRGYQDHGSQRPKDKWLPKSDYSFDNQHKELQARKESFEDTVAFLRGYLGVREDHPH